MNVFDWRSRTWRDRALFLAMLAAVVLLSSHPELRLLVPLLDALGIDLFVMLVGAQAWRYFRPLQAWLHRRLVRPMARTGYSVAIILFGCAGPYVDARLAVPFRHAGFGGPEAH